MTRKMRPIGTLLLGLSSVIVVHELGHFLLCKLLGVRVPIFSVGFGPKLIGYKIGNTFFQLALLPLGGYVGIDPASLATKTYAQKLAINLAGISFNILFAFIIFTYLARIMSKKKAIPIISEIIPDSPASHSPLQVADELLAIDQQPIKNDVSLLIPALQRSPGKLVLFKVNRSGITHNIAVTIGNRHPLLGSGVGWLGASFTLTETKPMPFISALHQSVLTTYSLIARMASVMFTLWKRESRSDVAGPISIINSARTQQASGSAFFLLWIAIINLNVALFNILPIPFLDGGHVVRDTIELFYGKSLPAGLMQVINMIFLILLMLLIVFVSAHDIKRLRKKQQ